MIVEKGLYYLYRHIRLDKNQIFYIGVGRKRVNRKLNTHKVEYERAFCRTRKNSIWKKIVEKTEYEVEIVMESDYEEFILQKEKEFISIYGRIDLKTGTLSNLTDGGEGIINPSIDTRKRISKALTGIKRSEHTKSLIRDAVLGTKKGPRSKEVKIKISQKNSGKKNGMYGIHGVDNKKSKTVLQYTIDNELVGEWINAREINKILGISYKDISACAVGKQKSAHGYIWKYKC